MNMEKEKSGTLNKWLALCVVIIGTFMSILDSSILNIAIPKLMAVFGVSLEDIKWILTSYTLALGAIIPLTGFLSDIFGNKKLYIFALGMFTLGSLLCGFAWSNTSMIVFRIIQALGGGMIMPVGMSIIYEIFKIEERGVAMGFWGIAAMAAPAIGPTLGGYIIENMDWRLIFFINIPIGIVGVFLAAILLKGSTRKEIKGFDYVGFISSAVGIVSILYVLGEGSSIDWSDISNPILLTIGILSFILFVFNELMHPDPLLDLRIFKIFDFTLSQIISGVLTFALMGGAYIMPMFLQNAMGYTAMQTGMILFPAAIATGFMMPISGILFDKLGAKPVVIPGLIVLFIASYDLASINANTSNQHIIWALVVRGLALGIAMMPISTVGMNAVPIRLIARASALSNTIKQIMSSLSITIMTTLMQDRVNINYAKLSEQITEHNEPAVNIIKQLQGLYMQNGLSQSEAKSSALSTLSGIVQKQAYIDAIDYSILVSAVAVILAIALTLMMRAKKTIKPEKNKKDLVNPKKLSEVNA